jgi:zinc protease
VGGCGFPLTRIRRRDALAFHGRWFSPGSALLVISGPVDAGGAVEEAERRLGRWKPLPSRVDAVPAATRRPRRVVVVDKADATQVQIRIAGVAIPRCSPDYFPATVGNAVLGGGFTSRLVEAIRVNRGLTYGVRSRFAVGRSTGLFSVSSFTKTGSAGELVAVALEEMARFAATGPSEEEVSRAASYLAGLFPLSLETHDQWADRIADAWIHGYAVEEVTGYPERIRSVTPGEAQAATARHLPLEDGVVLAVGPAGPLARQLARFGPVEVWPVRRVM